MFYNLYHLWLDEFMFLCFLVVYLLVCLFYLNGEEKCIPIKILDIFD